MGLPETNTKLDETDRSIPTPLKPKYLKTRELLSFMQQVITSASLAILTIRPEDVYEGPTFLPSSFEARLEAITKKVLVRPFEILSERE